jgi:hypothetical protein
MAIPIRGIPVLEGAAARRFLKETKANEKKRGIDKIPEEEKVAFQAFFEKARKERTFPS